MIEIDKKLTLLLVAGCLVLSSSTLSQTPENQNSVDQVPTSAPTTSPPPAPCTAPEHAQFDFWVGDWIVRTPDGKEAGRNRIEKILNGCVLLENWTGAQGSIGKSFNMYYAADRNWHQTWVDGNGTRLDLAGRWDNGRMMLQGTMPGADGKPVHHEISWTEQRGGKVEQYWRSSSDGGENWQDLFIGIYSKLPDGD